MSKRPKRDLEPLDVDAVNVVTIGTMLWGIALLAGLPFVSTLRRDGHLWWLQTTAVGFVLGLFGIWYCRRRRTALRRTASARPSEADELPPPLA